MEGEADTQTNGEAAGDTNAGIDIVRRDNILVAHPRGGEAVSILAPWDKPSQHSEFPESKSVEGGESPAESVVTIHEDAAAAGETAKQFHGEGGVGPDGPKACRVYQGDEGQIGRTADGQQLIGLGFRDGVTIGADGEVSPMEESDIDTVLSRHEISKEIAVTEEERDNHRLMRAINLPTDRIWVEGGGGHYGRRSLPEEHEAEETDTGGPDHVIAGKDPSEVEERWSELQGPSEEPSDNFVLIHGAKEGAIDTGDARSTTTIPLDELEMVDIYLRSGTRVNDDEDEVRAALPDHVLDGIEKEEEQAAAEDGESQIGV